MASFVVGPNGRTYRAVYVDGVRVLEHRLVWERANGPVPPGHDVHHRNDDSLDNRLSNLELLTKVDHHREHSDYWRRRNGVWEQFCRICGVWKLEAEFSRSKGAPRGECKPCRVRQEVERKKAR